MLGKIIVIRPFSCVGEGKTNSNYWNKSEKLANGKTVLEADYLGSSSRHSCPSGLTKPDHDFATSLLSRILKKCAPSHSLYHQSTVPSALAFTPLAFNYI